MIEKRGRHRLVGVASGFALLATSCGSGSAGLVGEAFVDNEPQQTAAVADQDLSERSEGQDRSAELVGRWEIVNYQLPDGAGLTNVVGNEPVFIEFGADGTVRYHTGCNGGGATYTTSGQYLVPESALDDTPEGQPIMIGPVFEQALEGCDGFLGEQDDDLPANMGNTTRFIIRDDNLLLLRDFMLIDATKS